MFRNVSMINIKGIKHYDYHHAPFILQPLVHNTAIMPNAPVVGTPQSPTIVQENNTPISQDEIGPIVDLSLIHISEPTRRS